RFSRDWSSDVCSSDLDDLREMARDLKNMEDGLLYEWRDVRKMREFYRTHEDRLHFDPEVYKRSTIVHRDLAEVRFRVDWDEKARSEERRGGKECTGAG